VRSSSDPNLSKSNPDSRATLFVISAASGTGKTSLNNRLVDTIPHLKMAISHTTRQPRSSEISGEHYYFIDEKTFADMREKEQFLEHATVFKNAYGTSKASVDTLIKKGNDVLLEIDWQGAEQIQTLFPRCVSIFILPPSLSHLEKRLSNRNQDTHDTIQHRLQKASEEISHYAAYDYLIINDDFDIALQEIKNIICSERMRTSRQAATHKKLLTSLTEVSLKS
jgi:guanylate kinase